MPDFPRVPAWVPAGNKVEWEKALFDAKLARVQKDSDGVAEVDQEFFKSIFAVAQQSIDRARDGADTVQKAAAAIAALYTSLLGVVFSVQDHPLPSRGIIPMLFLGLAILASTAYLAYLTRAKAVDVLTPAPSSFQQKLERARSFIEWTRTVVEHNSYLLKLSVVALAVGLVFLPAPFVSFKSAQPSNSSAVVTPDWPKPSENAGSNIELQKIVYAAQVEEAAEQRKPATTAPEDTGRNDAWWWAAAVALVLTLVAPLAIDRAFGRTQT
jgi:hypothetical protein